MDDDEDFGFDELDAEDLQAIEDVERKHASSQMPAASARPPAVVPKVVQPPKTKPFTKPAVPVAPIRRGAPSKPVYRDDFPNVEVDDKGGYKKRSELADKEKEKLQSELAQLRDSITQERKALMQKEGEVKILRSGAEKTAKEHRKQLTDEQSRSSALQERIAALERTATEEKARYHSEMLFARQEHESAVRQRAGTQRPATAMKNRVSSQQPKKVASPQRAKPPQKKGFMNSFFEDNQSKATAAPRSSPSEARPVASRKSSATTPAQLVSEKGKGRAMDEDTTFEQNYMPGDSPDLEEEHEELHRAPHSKREDFISFLFGHQAIPPIPPIASIHEIVNVSFQPDADKSVVEDHRKACQTLFASLGQAAAPAEADLDYRDRLFLASLISCVTRFLDIFLQARMRDELILSLYLLRDLFFHFRTVLFHQTIIVKEQNIALKAVFATLARAVRQEHLHVVQDTERRKQAQQSASIPRSHMSATRPPPIKEHDIRAKLEREIEPVLHAILEVLLTLAWRPDDNSLADFDVVLREPEFVSSILDPFRPTGVVIQALDLLLLLSCQPSLFRTVLASPFSRNGIDRVSSGPSAGDPATRLAFIETIAVLLQFKTGSQMENYYIHQAALAILSTLAVEHVDGLPLLGSSSSLVQRLIVRNATDASVLYESGGPPSGTISSASLVKGIEASLRLLYMLVMSRNSAKTLANHLAEKPSAREWFVSGAGRIAYTDVPEWLEEDESIQILDHLASMANDLLVDVLAPDEIDSLWALCHDDEEGDEDGLEDLTGQGRNNEEQMLANENVDAMEN